MVIQFYGLKIFNIKIYITLPLLCKSDVFMIFKSNGIKNSMNNYWPKLIAIPQYVHYAVVFNSPYSDFPNIWIHIDIRSHGSQNFIYDQEFISCIIEIYCFIEIANMLLYTICL
jgi:hypothetical protein